VDNSQQIEEEKFENEDFNKRSKKKKEKRDKKNKNRKRGKNRGPIYIGILLNDKNI